MKSNTLTTKATLKIGFNLLLALCVVALIANVFEMPVNTALLIGLCSHPLVYFGFAWYETSKYNKEVLEINQELLQDTILELQTANRGVERMSTEIDVLKTQLGNALDSNRQLSDSWDALNRLTAKQQNRINELLHDNGQLNEDNAAMTTRIAELEKALWQEVEQQKQMEKAVLQIQPLKNTIVDLEKKLNTSRSQATQRKNLISKLRDELSELTVSNAA